MAFKPYIPPTTLPKTIRKGMTMDKFPLWAWPVFSRTVVIYASVDRSRKPTVTFEEKPALDSTKRKRMLKKANDFVEGYEWKLSRKAARETLDYYDEGAGPADLSAYYSNLFDTILGAGKALSPELLSVVFSLQMPRVVAKYFARGLETYTIESVKRDGNATHIVWSTYAGYDFYAQTIKGRSSSGMFFESEALGYEFLRVLGTEAAALIDFMRTPSGALPWDEQGRAYIEFDMKGDYTATVRSVAQLHDFLSREGGDIKGGRILEVAPSSAFTEENLVIALLMHGVEVQ